MLSPQDIEKLKRVTSPGFQNSQPMTPEQAKASFSATTTEPSRYDIAMGKINPDGTSNTSKGIIPQAIDTFKEGFKQTQTGGEMMSKGDILQGLQQVGRGTLNEMGAGVRAVFSPVEAGLKVVSGLPGFKQALGAVEDYVINPAANKISDNKHLQDFMQSNPHADEVFNNLLAIASTVVGGAKAPEIKALAEKTGATIADTASNVATKIGETVAPAVEKVKGMVTSAPVSPEELAIQLKTKAIEDTTPAYNKKLIGETVTNSEGKIIPRINEAQGFNRRTVTSSAKEIAAGEELAKIPNYNPDATALEKYNTVKSYNLEKAKTFESDLAKEKIIIPKKELTNIIKKSVDNASQDSLLIQKTDPIVKNYMRVTKNAIAQNDGTLSGELAVRKALDRAYQDAGGEYANNKGLDQIHRAARNALNDDMEARAMSTQVKASLKEQSNLYNAADVLLEKARAEGGSAWEQFKKAHPIIYKAGNKILNIAGLGEGVNIITH